jgi:hypothetical protein
MLGFEFGVRKYQSDEFEMGIVCSNVNEQAEGLLYRQLAGRDLPA